MSDSIIAETLCQAIIGAPLSAVDLPDWVFTITDQEYQACSKDHIAAGSNRTADGKRVSINVEKIGDLPLLVQHYVEDIAERHHARQVSETDVLAGSLDNRAKVRVVWELTADAVDSGTSRLVNRVVVYAGPGFREATEASGVSFHELQAGVKIAMDAHNAEETPLFAKDIARKANEGRWALGTYV